MENIFNYLIEPYTHYAGWRIALEIIATVLGIASTYFSMKRNIWVFPTGIVSTGIYIYLLFRAGLYGDTLINVYYTSMSIYGWILWNNVVGNDQVHVSVLRMTKKEVYWSVLLFIASVLLVLGIYYYRPIIKHNFDWTYHTQIGPHYTVIDFFDAGLTATFLLGMWLMARRKLENWIFWIIGDVVAIWLFIVKGLGITAIQYAVFLVLAIIGFIQWRKQLRETAPHLEKSSSKKNVLQA